MNPQNKYPSPQQHVIEEQLVLRAPPEVAKCIRRMLKHQDAPSLSFTMKNERQGTFYCGEKPYKLTLADLPCYIDSHKTIDRRTYYKNADIAQILVIEPMDPPPPDPNANDPVVDASFAIDSGITPPTCHITRLMWRRTPKFPVQEIAHVIDDIVRICKKQDVQETVKIVHVTREQIEQAKIAAKSGLPTESVIATPSLESQPLPPTSPEPPQPVQAPSALSRTGGLKISIRLGRKGAPAVLTPQAGTDQVPLSAEEAAAAIEDVKPDAGAIDAAKDDAESHHEMAMDCETRPPETPPEPPSVSFVQPLEPPLPQAVLEPPPKAAPQMQELVADRQRLINEFAVLEKRHQELLVRLNREANRIMRRRTEGEIVKIKDDMKAHQAAIQDISDQLEKGQEGEGEM